LFLFAQNIVDGMSYLCSKGIIHRDLAARNILIANEETAKISDFGLARRVASDEGDYVMTSNTNVPVKWLAIECLTKKAYSHASDVWAFGVVLWEMFSMGAAPALPGCQDFFASEAGEGRHREDLTEWLRLLEEGVRLPCPEECHPSVYAHLMQPCWKREPTERPTFSELGRALSKVELEVT